MSFADNVERRLVTRNRVHVGERVDVLWREIHKVAVESQDSSVCEGQRYGVSIVLVIVRNSNEADHAELETINVCLVGVCHGHKGKKKLQLVYVTATVNLKMSCSETQVLE